MIEVHPLVGIGEVLAGDSLIDVLLRALERATLSLRPDDVLVVTQKIVSKAEGCFAQLGDRVPDAQAHEIADVTGKDPCFVALVLAESVAVVRAAPGVLITRHRLGFVMANAGIDRSNSGSRDEERVLLLPRDPDASAQRLAQDLAATLGVAPAIVITDSFGRPWRKGVTSVAIGAHGLACLVDRRGARDREGRRLEVTEIAIADQIAAAAGLVMGEADESVPAALVRGCVMSGAASPATALVRPSAEDLFR